MTNAAENLVTAINEFPIKAANITFFDPDAIIISFLTQIQTFVFNINSCHKFAGGITKIGIRFCRF